MHSFANGAGTANVTPLTAATVLLATGQAPDALMSGTAGSLTTSSIGNAQTQLRNSLSSVLSTAGVSNRFDFISGASTVCGVSFVLQGPNGDVMPANPRVGFTRSGDDTWITLPSGTAGDTVIRNFYRGGRSVTVSLYSNANCSTPFVVDGRSSFEVDVDGVPPVSSALATMPWPEIDDASKTALRNLALANGASGELSAAWSFTRGPLGVNGATVCSSRASCGQGSAGRIGERDLRPSQRSVTVSLSNTGPAIGANDDKSLMLYGRNGEGVDLQSIYSSCPSFNPGDACH